MLAMSAMSLQHISGGRFVLGIGTSGPQVMEGWHGTEFSRPVRRTRETIEIIRMIAAGERLSYSGEVYRLPLPGSEGVAIRSRAEPCIVPIYIAALGPANLALTGELADGWIGNSFFTESADVFFAPLGAAARQAGRSLSDLDLVVAVSLEFTEDIEAAGRRHADGYAFTFGAMGSRGSNFYNNAFARQGFGDDVAEVQRLWAEGDRATAAARVPIEIGLGTNLIGPPTWSASGCAPTATAVSRHCGSARWAAGCRTALLTWGSLSTWSRKQTSRIDGQCPSCVDQPSLRV